jgi:hypothetical protein
MDEVQHSALSQSPPWAYPDAAVDRLVRSTSSLADRTAPGLKDYGNEEEEVMEEVVEEEGRVLKMSVCLVASLANSASARPFVLYYSILRCIEAGFMAVQPTLSFAGICGTLYAFAVVGMAAAAATTTTTITLIARFARAGEFPQRG